MSNLFNTKGYFTADISRWDVSSVTTMYQMFSFANRFNADISQWDVSSVTTMHMMFRSNWWFNADISRWDVSSVTSMAFTFLSASSFNADISRWDVSSVTTTQSMFADATAFNQRYNSQWTRIDDACDASYPPLNGAVGNCTDTLVSGASCVPDVQHRVRAEGRNVVHRPGTDGGVCAFGIYQPCRAEGDRGRVPGCGAVG